MRALVLTLIATAWLMAPVRGPAQSTDMAAERARIADQRIQAEAERRAREEEQRQEEAEARAAEGRAAAAALRQPEVPDRPRETLPPVAVTGGVPPAAPAAGADLSDSLEQIRTLGELRDAGYVTEDEFERIKARILGDVIP